MTCCLTFDASFVNGNGKSCNSNGTDHDFKLIDASFTRSTRFDGRTKKVVGICKCGGDRDRLWRKRGR